MNQGFLGTAASRSADLVVLLELAMGLALIAGALLARRQKFRAHAWCQSAVVILNFCVIALFMLPSFRESVAPKIPAGLNRSYYWVSTTHAALGAGAELVALYILIAAGTKWLPERLRLQRYKLWMRSVVVLWWVVILFGLATYARWYVH